MTLDQKNYVVRLALGILASISLVLHSAGIIELFGVNKVDNLFYDLKLQLTTEKSGNKDIVILDIDEESLKNPELGRWPWSRNNLALIIEKLFNDYQISVLGLDIVLSEADESSGLKILEKLRATSLSSNQDFIRTLDKIKPTLEFDKLFASTLEKYPIVLGYYFNFDKGSAKTGILPEPILEEGDTDRINIAAPKAVGYGSNLELIQEASLFAGHFNPLTDVDGVIRRLPTLVEFEKNYYESLSLAVFRLYSSIKAQATEQGILPERITGIDVQPRPKNDVQTTSIEAIEVGKTHIPVDRTGSLLVPFQGPRGTFNYYSAHRVFNGTLEKEALRGKIVLLGTTAPGLSDFRSTAAGPFFPGVEVHANALAGMLDADRLIKSYPSYLHIVETGFIAVLAIVLSLLLPKLTPLQAFLTTSIAALVVIASNFYAWSIGLSMPITALLTCLVIIFMINMAYGYFIESKAKRDFSKLFAQYIPPKLVDVMAKDPSKYSMEVEKKELTILFADIVGFTSIGEKLSPKELSVYVNRYLSEMSAVIADCEGTIDKYIGDAIMAFWGAPIENNAHADAGVRAAILMQRKVKEINEEFSKLGWPTLRIGVGVATGSVVVGDMGSNIRRAYTVMGDTVILASRLEGATRQYGVGVLIAESSVISSQKEGEFREIDHVAVKGKQIAVRIFEPKALMNSTDPEQELVLWNDLLKLYQAGDWIRCSEYLSIAKDKFPGSATFTKLEERVRLNQGKDVNDWNGITKLDSK